jgi:hypothetical protein
MIKGKHKGFSLWKRTFYSDFLTTGLTREKTKKGMGLRTYSQQRRSTITLSFESNPIDKLKGLNIIRQVKPLSQWNLERNVYRGANNIRVQPSNQKKSTRNVT